MVTSAIRGPIDHSIGPFFAGDSKFVRGRSLCHTDDVPASAMLDSQESISTLGMYENSIPTDQALHEMHAPPKFQVPSRVVVSTSNSRSLQNTITPNQINKLITRRQETPPWHHPSPDNVRTETFGSLKSISSQQSVKESALHNHDDNKKQSSHNDSRGKAKKKHRTHLPRRDFRRAPHLQEALDRIKDRRSEEERPVSPRLQAAMDRILAIDEMQERQCQGQHGSDISAGHASDDLSSSIISHALGREIKELGKLRDTSEIFSEYETILKHLVRKHGKLKAYVDGEVDYVPQQFSFASEDVRLRLQRLRESRADGMSKSGRSRARNLGSKGDRTEEDCEVIAQKESKAAPIKAKLLEDTDFKRSSSSEYLSNEAHVYRTTEEVGGVPSASNNSDPRKQRPTTLQNPTVTASRELYRSPVRNAENSKHVSRSTHYERPSRIQQLRRELESLRSRSRERRTHQATPRTIEDLRTRDPQPVNPSIQEGSEFLLRYSSAPGTSQSGQVHRDSNRSKRKPARLDVSRFRSHGQHSEYVGKDHPVRGVEPNSTMRTRNLGPPNGVFINARYGERSDPSPQPTISPVRPSDKYDERFGHLKEKSDRRRRMPPHPISSVARDNHDFHSHSGPHLNDKHLEGLEDALLKLPALLAKTSITVPDQTHNDFHAYPSPVGTSFDGTDPETDYANSADVGDHDADTRKNQYCFAANEIPSSTLHNYSSNRYHNDIQNPHVRSDTLSKLLPDPANPHRPVGSRSKILSELLPERPPKDIRLFPPKSPTRATIDARDDERHQYVARSSFQPTLHYGYPEQNHPYSRDDDPTLRESRDNFLPVSSSTREPWFPVLSNLTEATVNNEEKRGQSPLKFVSSIGDNEGGRLASPTPSEKARRLLVHVGLVQSFSQELQAEQAQMREEMMELKQRYRGSLNVLNQRARQIRIVGEALVTEIIDPEAEHDEEEDGIVQEDTASVGHILMAESEDGVIHVATGRDGEIASGVIVRLDDVNDTHSDEDGVISYTHAPSSGEQRASTSTAQLQQPPQHFLKPSSSYKSHPPPDIVQPSYFSDSSVRVDDRLLRNDEDIVDAEDVDDGARYYSDDEDPNDDEVYDVHEQYEEESHCYETMAEDGAKIDGHGPTNEHLTVERHYYATTVDEDATSDGQGQGLEPVEEDEGGDERDYYETMTDDDDEGDGHSRASGPTDSPLILEQPAETGAATRSCATARRLQREASVVDPTRIALRRMPQNLLSTGSCSSVSSSARDPSSSSRQLSMHMILEEEDGENAADADESSDIGRDDNADDLHQREVEKVDDTRRRNLGLQSAFASVGAKKKQGGRSRKKGHRFNLRRHVPSPPRTTFAVYQHDRTDDDNNMNNGEGDYDDDDDDDDDMPAGARTLSSPRGTALGNGYHSQTLCSNPLAGWLGRGRKR
jgi:hypothetical protein